MIGDDPVMEGFLHNRLVSDMETVRRAVGRTVVWERGGRWPRVISPGDSGEVTSTHCVAVSSPVKWGS